jgi:hypothetical protein
MTLTNHRWPTASAPNARISIPSHRTGDSNGKVGIAVDGEIQAFTIFLARPLTSPHLPSRIIRKPLIGRYPAVRAVSQCPVAKASSC